MKLNYLRVIPRDLFNEASLLKCYGQLYLLTEGNPNARFIQDSVDSFKIGQSQMDGSLTVANLSFVVGSTEYLLTRPLNSREPWPLYAEKKSDYSDPISVFAENGQLSEEMESLINMAMEAR